MGDLYRILCWSLGGGMIVLATVCSLFAGQAEQPENLTAQKA